MIPDPASQKHQVETLNGLAWGDKSMRLCVCVGVHVLVHVCDEFKAFSRTGIKSQFGQGDIKPFAL